MPVNFGPSIVCSLDHGLLKTWTKYLNNKIDKETDESWDIRIYNKLSSNSNQEMKSKIYFKSD